MNNGVRKTILEISLASIIVAISGCNPRVGTYSNENGTIVLDLKSGGKASLTFLGESRPCSYSEEKNQVTLDCAGETTVFTVHDDGSLTGPGQVGILRKSKK